MSLDPSAMKVELSLKRWKRANARRDRPGPNVFGPGTAAHGLRNNALGDHAGQAVQPSRADPARWDFSKGLPVAGTDLGHCLSGWDGRFELRWSDRDERLRVVASDMLRHLVIYSRMYDGGSGFAAVEPVSHSVDAFNLADAGDRQTGAQVLDPGDTLAGSVRFEILNDNGGGMDARNLRMTEVLKEVRADWALLTTPDAVVYSTGHLVPVETGPSPFGGAQRQHGFHATARQRVVPHAGRVE